MSRKSILVSVLLLTGVTASSHGASLDGTVVEVTSETVTVRGEKQTATFKVCAELLTNTVLVGDPFLRSANLADVKKGRRVHVEFVSVNGDWVCTQIRVYPTEKEMEDEKTEKRKKEKGDFNFGGMGDKGG